METGSGKRKRASHPAFLSSDKQVVIRKYLLEKLLLRYQLLLQLHRTASSKGWLCPGAGEEVSHIFHLILVCSDGPCVFYNTPGRGVSLGLVEAALQLDSPLPALASCLVNH